MEEKPTYGTEENTMKFLKEAFCIDGEIKCLGSKLINALQGVSIVFELNDSKRGKFFVTLSK